MVLRLAGDEPLVPADLERLRSASTDDRPFELPYFWGAFISQGDEASFVSV
jgi:hypothetical protein